MNVQLSTAYCRPSPSFYLAAFKLRADAKYAAYEKRLDDKVDQWIIDKGLT
jgi:hypothetical protein